MHAASATATSALPRAESISCATQTEARATDSNGTLGKIAAVLGHIKNAVIEPGLAKLQAGIRKVDQWCYAHPTAAVIFGAAIGGMSLLLMASSIAHGNPFLAAVGGMGMVAGATLMAVGVGRHAMKRQNDKPHEAAPGPLPADIPARGPLEQDAPTLNAPAASPNEAGDSREPRESTPRATH